MVSLALENHQRGEVHFQLGVQLMLADVRYGIASRFNGIPAYGQLAQTFSITKILTRFECDVAYLYHFVRREKFCFEAGPELGTFLPPNMYRKEFIAPFLWGGKIGVRFDLSERYAFSVMPYGGITAPTRWRFGYYGISLALERRREKKRTP